MGKKLRIQRKYLVEEPSDVKLPPVSNTADVGVRPEKNPQSTSSVLELPQLAQLKAATEAAQRAISPTGRRKRKKNKNKKLSKFAKEKRILMRQIDQRQARWEKEAQKEVTSILEMDWAPGGCRKDDMFSTANPVRKGKMKRRRKKDPGDDNAEVKKLLANLTAKRLASQRSGMSSFAQQSQGLQDVMTKITVCSGEQGVPIRKLLLALDHADGEGDLCVKLSEMKGGLAVFGLELSDRDMAVLKCYLDIDTEGQFHIAELTRLQRFCQDQAMTEGWSLPGAAAKMRKAKEEAVAKGMMDGDSKYELPEAIKEAFIKFTSKHSLSVIELFRKCDSDMDGIINGKEFMGGLSAMNLGLTVPQMEEVVLFVDQDGDGKIEYHEFAKVFHRLVPMNRHADAAIPEFDAKAKTDMLHYLERIQQASKEHREKKMHEDELKVSERDAQNLYRSIDSFLTKNTQLWAQAEKTEQGWLSKDLAESGIPCKKPTKGGGLFGGGGGLPAISIDSKATVKTMDISLGGIAKLFG